MYGEYFCRSHTMSQRHDPQLRFTRNDMFCHIIEAQPAEQLINSIVTIFHLICRANDGHYRFQMLDSNKDKNQFSFDNKKKKLESSLSNALVVFRLFEKVVQFCNRCGNM